MSQIRFHPLIQAAVAVLGFTGAQLQAQELQFIFTSDAHYGITRAQFQGAQKVDAHAVNAALVAKINALPGQVVPNDGGVKAGKPVGAIDFVVEGGDITNRQEKGIQSASTSWAQFKTDYIDRLEVKDGSGRKAPIFLIPGNHDVSNAIGYTKPLEPASDATAMEEIYNRMLTPSTPKTAATYAYTHDKISYSRTMGGIHFVFLTLWPDSQARTWLDKDLKDLPQSLPVILFAHDQPDIETKHLTNPNGSNDINATDKFENMVADKASEKSVSEPSTREQRELTDFLKAHATITAYFHGNANWNQFYEWTGTDGSIALHTFRVDSPMKGELSASDETRLSFQLVSIDPKTCLMTVRECLWNADPKNPAAPVVFGGSTTVSLKPRQVNAE